jgi:hypothetical protein
MEKLAKLNIKTPLAVLKMVLLQWVENSLILRRLLGLKTEGRARPAGKVHIVTPDCARKHAGIQIDRPGSLFPLAFFSFSFSF